MIFLKIHFLRCFGYPADIRSINGISSRTMILYALFDIVSSVLIKVCVDMVEYNFNRDFIVPMPIKWRSIFVGIG